MAIRQWACWVSNTQAQEKLIAYSIPTAAPSGAVFVSTLKLSNVNLKLEVHHLSAKAGCAKT